MCLIFLSSFYLVYWQAGLDLERGREPSLSHQKKSAWSPESLSSSPTFAALAAVTAQRWVDSKAEGKIEPKDSDLGSIRCFKVQKAGMIIWTAATQSEEFPQATPVIQSQFKALWCWRIHPTLWQLVSADRDHHHRTLCLVPSLNLTFSSTQQTSGFDFQCKALYWDEWNLWESQAIPTPQKPDCDILWTFHLWWLIFNSSNVVSSITISPWPFL